MVLPKGILSIKECSAPPAHFTLICKKYPTYQDFDLIDKREHVLYAGALLEYSVEDIEERYLDLVKVSRTGAKPRR